MKKDLYFKSIFTFLITLLCHVGFGQQTVEFKFVNGTNISLNGTRTNSTRIDENISFSTHKNSGTSNPTINSNQLRLYQNSNKGGSIKLYSKNDVKISKLEIFASGNDGKGPGGFSIDGSEYENISFQNGVYTINVSNPNSNNEIEFWNKGTSNSQRTYIDKIIITYSLYVSTAPTITTNPIALTGLTTTIGTASEAKAFTLTGTNLTSDVVYVTVPSEYEAKLNTEEDTEYRNQLNIQTLTSKQINIRLKSNNTVGTYSGNVVVTGGGTIAPLNIPIDGEVVPLPNTPLLLPNQIFAIEYGKGGNYAVNNSGGEVNNWEPLTSLANGITYFEGVFTVGSAASVGNYTYDVTASNAGGSSTAAVTIKIAKANQKFPDYENLTKRINDPNVALHSKTIHKTNENFNGETNTIEYTSSDPSIVEIVEIVDDYELKFVGEGTATITARSLNTNPNFEPLEEIEFTVEVSELFNVSYNQRGIFELVTDENQIEEGIYIFSVLDDNKFMNSTMNNKKLGFVNQAIINNKVIDPDLEIVWKIEFNELLKNIKSLSKHKYLVNNSGTDLRFDDYDLGNNLLNWKIVKNYNNEFSIISDIHSRYLMYNGTIFGAYASQNVGVSPYKRLNLYKLISTVWDGVTWSNGKPNSKKIAIIQGGYSPNFKSFTAHSLIVEHDINIPSGVTINLINEFNNSQNKNIIFEEGAYLLQGNDLAENFGNATFKRNATFFRYDSKFWSSPVEEQSISGFMPNPSGIYTYDTEDSNWDNTTDTEFLYAKGYIFQAGSDYPFYGNGEQILFDGKFTGVPHNGNYSIPVSYTGLGDNGVGNPYGSPISASAFLNENDHVTHLYFWGEESHYIPGTNPPRYEGQRWSALNKTGHNEGPTKFIGVGVGFIARVSSADNLVFNNSMRTSVTNAGDIYNRTSTEKDRFWLSLNLNNTKENQILIGYVEGATNGIDEKYDAKNLSNNNSFILSHSNANAMIIEGRQYPLDVNDQIPLYFRASELGDYTIKLENKEGIFNSQPIYLIDNDLNLSINLNEETEYTFNSEIGNFTDRFEIRYQPKETLSTNDLDDTTDLIVYKNDNLNKVTSKENVNGYKVYDFSGKLITTEKVNQLKDFSLTNQNKGTYIVKFALENGRVISKKVIF
ncbi:MAG: T9SS type A sorting domain-containing protein [Weeksellaceae bacterium]|nr:T9SS type A sorting domain-containing protein [Weeksellaceae bacterium]